MKRYLARYTWSLITGNNTNISLITEKILLEISEEHTIETQNTNNDDQRDKENTVATIKKNTPRHDTKSKINLIKQHEDSIAAAREFNPNTFRAMP